MKSERQVPPLDCVWPLNTSVWLYGLRIPFTLMFLATMSIVSGLAPQFSPARYGIAILVFCLGLSGAHYLDVVKGRGDFEAFLGKKVPASMLPAGLALVAASLVIGLYFGMRWGLPWVWLFGAVCVLGAYCYSTERPKALHSPLWFAFFWAFIPGLVVYYALTGTVTLYGVAITLFLGILLAGLLPVFQMHKTEAGKKVATTTLMAYFLASTLGAILLNLTHALGR